MGFELLEGFGFDTSPGDVAGPVLGWGLQSMRSCSLDLWFKPYIHDTSVSTQNAKEVAASVASHSSNAMARTLF